jgi:hypothetical protein
MLNFSCFTSYCPIEFRIIPLHRPQPPIFKHGKNSPKRRILFICTASLKALFEGTFQKIQWLKKIVRNFSNESGFSEEESNLRSPEYEARVPTATPNP